MKHLKDSKKDTLQFASAVQPDQRLIASRGNKIVDGLAMFLTGAAGMISVHGIPIGSPIAAAIGAGFSAAKDRRMKLLLDEIAKQGIQDLPPETLESEEFVQAFTSAARAAASTQQDEKIKLFAQMFATYANGQVTVSSDEYEEQMRILEDLSVREFNVLLAINRHQQNVTDEQDYLVTLLDRIAVEAGVNLRDIPATLERLRRTGLYQVQMNSARPYYEHRRLRLDFDYGHLTHNFDRFIEVLGLAGNSGTCAPPNPIQSTKSTAYNFEHICYSLSEDLPKQRAAEIMKEVQSLLHYKGFPFNKRDSRSGQYMPDDKAGNYKCIVPLGMGDDLNGIWAGLTNFPDVVDIWLPEDEVDEEKKTRSAIHRELRNVFPDY